MLSTSTNITSFFSVLFVELIFLPSLAGVAAGEENNTSVGTLQNNLTGRQNTAIGVNALYSNTAGNRNTANGVNALYDNMFGRLGSGLYI